MVRNMTKEVVGVATSYTTEDHKYTKEISRVWLEDRVTVSCLNKVFGEGSKLLVRKHHVSYFNELYARHVHRVRVVVDPNNSKTENNT